MSRVFLILFLILSCLACTNENQQPFDKEKWTTKEGKEYLYRNQMVQDLVYNDTIRTLNKTQLLELLGEPSYIRAEYLYYRITETRLGSWTIHTKTIVIKLKEDTAIEWIKIHE